VGAGGLGVDADEQVTQPISEQSSPAISADPQRRDNPNLCPACLTLPRLAQGHPRLAHWKQAHASQDLSYQQVRWLLKTRLDRDIFLLEFPPDYRLPHARNEGMRFWTMATVSKWLGESETPWLKPGA